MENEDDDEEVFYQSNYRGKGKYRGKARGINKQLVKLFVTTSQEHTLIQILNDFWLLDCY